MLLQRHTATTAGAEGGRSSTRSSSSSSSPAAQSRWNSANPRHVRGRSVAAAAAAAAGPPPAGGSTPPPPRSNQPPPPQQQQQQQQQLRQAGPAADACGGPEPNYTAIDAVPLNRVVMGLFRRKMVAAIGTDSQLQGYPAIIDLTRQLNSAFPAASHVQQATRGILNSLFPSWLPGAFKVMFSGPMPDFSCRLNAFATAATCTWLMGPCRVNDVEELDDGRVGNGMGVLVERCRYLEQAGCASICINSCKVPTQEFFAQDMGLPLTMTPNYDDFSCQFSFGKTPPPQHLDEAFSTPCFLQCPSRAPRYTDGSMQKGGKSSNGGGGSSANCPNIPSGSM